MALTGLAIAAAMALAKDQLVDQPAAARKRKLAAATQRLSPWTGKQADAPDAPNTVGTMMQYGATGAQIGSGMTQAKSDNALKDAMTNRLNTGGSLGGGLSSGYGKDMTGNTQNPWSGSGQDAQSFWNKNQYE